MSEIQPASNAQVDPTRVPNPVDQVGQFNGRAVIAGLYTNMRYHGVAALSEAQQRDIDRLVQLNDAVNKRLDNAEQAMRLLVAYDFTDGSDNDLTEQILMDYKKVENYFLNAEIASLEAELDDGLPPRFPNTVMNIKRLSLPEADISSDDGSFDYDALYDSESSPVGAGKPVEQQPEENERTFDDGNSMPDFTQMDNEAMEHYFNGGDNAGAKPPKDGALGNDQGDAVL